MGVIEKKSRNKNRVFRRFVYSFMAVLCVPIVCFVFVFFRYYRQVYREEIITQAQSSLEAVGMELERQQESFHALTLYNQENSPITPKIVLKDYRAAQIREMLYAMRVSYAVLDNVYYYTDINPERIYNYSGAYSLQYFADTYAGMEKEELRNILLEKDVFEWQRWNKKNMVNSERISTLQYIIRYDEREAWIFTFSESALRNILSAENAVTRLFDEQGNCLYSTGDLKTGEYCELSFAAPGGQFQIVRYIEKDSLFKELNMWQTVFLLTVLVILLVGGMLVLLLTYYIEHPIRSLLGYVYSNIQGIPENLDSLEVFQYAMKSLEEQNLLLEKEQETARLLLYLLYAQDVDTDSFRYLMNKNKLFVNAECYRVILAMPVEGDEAGGGNAGLRLVMSEEPGCEFRIVNIPSKEASVVVAGMTEAAEIELEKVLRQIQDKLSNNINRQYCFYVGGKYTELKKINHSYSEALSVSRIEQEKVGKVYFYQKENGPGEMIIYPHDRLNELYNSLIEMNLESAFGITDTLIGILQEYSDNRFVSVSLYYDMLNVFYRAQVKLQLDIDDAFIEMDLLEVRDNPDAIRMILRVKEQYRDYVEMVRNKQQEQKGNKEDNEVFMKKVLSYLEENGRSANLSVSLVADYFDVSISLLGYKFKKYMNRTLSDYIMEKKYQYACELLRDTDDSVKEIAEKLGYSHPVSFIRNFKQQCKMTPAEYREAMRREKDLFTKD